MPCLILRGQTFEFSVTPGDIFQHFELIVDGSSGLDPLLDEFFSSFLQTFFFFDQVIIAVKHHQFFRWDKTQIVTRAW